MRETRKETDTKGERGRPNTRTHPTHTASHERCSTLDCFTTKAKACWCCLLRGFECECAALLCCMLLVCPHPTSPHTTHNITWLTLLPPTSCHTLFPGLVLAEQCYLLGLLHSVPQIKSSNKHKPQPQVHRHPSAMVLASQTSA